MTARCATLRRYAVRVLARTAVLVVLSVVASWRRGAAQTATWIASPPGPTVGDTIWVERAIVVPAGWQVRAGKLDATEAVERSEEHTSELQSRLHLVCRLLLEKKK